MFLSKFIPKQIHVPYIGALYELAGRVFFFISLANFILTTRLYYYNQGDSLLRDIFQSYWLFMLAFCLLGIIVAAFVWAVLLPSQMKFMQDQSVIEGRSPIFEKICELQQQLTEMQEKINSLEKK